VTDRIDSLTHEELKSATRELVKAARVWESYASNPCPISEALRAFEPTPLDRLRDFLKAEGWTASTGTPRAPGIAIYTTKTAEYFRLED